MRFIGLIFTLLAAIALAQTQQNYINVPAAGFDATAGQPITITWQNPSSGTVTIRLTQGNVAAPNSGVQLITGIPASAQTATVTIPANVNAAAYNFEIVDDTNPDNVNFSSAFTITGGSVSASVSSASASASASATASSASASATASLSSLSSSLASSLSSASSSHLSSLSSMSASASSAASSMTRSASSASSSASASATSVAANSGAFAAVGISGMAAFLAGAVAVM